MRSPTERFSDRVADYVKYRPGYPQEVLQLLQEECGLSPGSTVADLGSGTGRLSHLLSGRVLRVFGIEPNRPMREAAERLLAGHNNFVSVAGTAEATGLEDQSVDLATAAQAFHWFEPGATRRELERILRPDGWVALIWNERRKHATPFLEQYESLLLRHATDYAEVDHTHIGPTELESFFGPRGYRSARFDNRQRLDFDGLRGRLLSSSYAPRPPQSGYEAMLEDLRDLFDRHQEAGRVTFEYDCWVHFGQLS